MKIKYIFILFSLLFYKAQAQAQAQDINAQLIVFEDLNLIQHLGDIISENESSQEGVWYVEFEDSNNIILSKTHLPNLMRNAQIKNKELYVTTIDKTVVFILVKKRFDELLNKTWFYVDLSPYAEWDLTYFSHFSYWYIQRINNLYVVVKKKIIKRD